MPIPVGMENDMAVSATKDFKHGVAAYNVHRCRCSVCVTAKKKATVERRKRLNGKEPPVHGTSSSYSVYGCRCEICVEARKKFRREYEGALAGTEPPEHGLVGYCVYKCRCDVCVGARRDSDAKRMRRPEVYAKEKERCWKKYGIVGFTYDDYCQMFESQDGKCAICGRGMKMRSRKKAEVANVDHNHETGMVRALLCNDCNKMLGCGGSSDILRKGAEYLDTHVMYVKEVA